MNITIEVPLPSTPVKSCSKCRQWKPETAEFFNLQKHGKRGLTADCRECHKLRMRQVNKIQYAKNREREMIDSYAKSDAKNGRLTTITTEWMKENITSKPCFYCETIEAPRGSDRLDNGIGHVPENVVPCCKLCNKTRNNHFSPDEMKLLGQVIKKIRKARL
jgi:hypothetical protein